MAPNQTKSNNTKTFEAGQFLFHENDPSHSMYLIIQGSVSIRKYKGQEYAEVARIHSNEVLGELSFFDREPRSASAIALTQVEVVELQFEALEKLFATVPDYLKTIIASMANRLRQADDTICRLKRGTNQEATQNTPETSKSRS